MRPGKLIRFSNSTLSAGFTLVEVLVAVLILAIGLLGMAGLQVTGLQANNAAYLRSQATELAYEFADRIRANRVAIYTVEGTETAPPPKDCISSSCNSAEMSAADIYQWLTSVRSTFPLGTATVTQNGGIYVINISWDDNRDGLVNNNAGDTVPDDPVFTVSVQP